MATWHQQQNKQPLWHPTKWALINDPPNGCRSAFLFSNLVDAEDQMKRTGGYILPPGGDWSKFNEPT